MAKQGVCKLIPLNSRRGITKEEKRARKGTDEWALSVESRHDRPCGGTAIWRPNCVNRALDGYWCMTVDPTRCSAYRSDIDGFGSRLTFRDAFFSNHAACARVSVYHLAYLDVSCHASGEGIMPGLEGGRIDGCIEDSLISSAGVTSKAGLYTPCHGSLPSPTPSGDIRTAQISPVSTFRPRTCVASRPGRCSILILLFRISTEFCTYMISQPQRTHSAPVLRDRSTVVTGATTINGT